MKDIVNKFLADLLATIGIRQIRSLKYALLLHDVTHLLTFGLRSDPRDWFALSCNVGIAFRKLPSIAENTPTDPIPHIVMPLHMLKPGENFEEWTFEDKSTLKDLGGQIRTDIERFGLPCLAEYSVVENVRNKLEGSPDQWFVLSPEQRLNLLAAILHTQGQKEIAIGMLDEELAKRAKSLPKYRLPIERMRNRLLRDE